MCNEQNKKCKKCGLDKPISEYYFFNSKNRYSSQCKTCINIRNQKWKDNSREHHRAYCRKWNNDNKERKKENDTKYNLLNKDKVEKRRTKWYLKNKEKISEKNKVRYYDNIEKRTAQIKKWKELNKEKYNNGIRKWKKEKRTNDIDYISKEKIRNCIVQSIVRNRHKKTLHTEILLGTSIQKAREWIEKQFKPGMNWANHGNGEGKWNIDHIIPINLFDFNNLEEQKMCNHYTNLQPLWWQDNMTKKDKVLVFTSEGCFLI